MDQAIMIQMAVKYANRGNDAPKPAIHIPRDARNAGGFYGYVEGYEDGYTKALIDLAPLMEGLNRMTTDDYYIRYHARASRPAEMYSVFKLKEFARILLAKVRGVGNGDA